MTADIPKLRELLAKVQVDRALDAACPVGESHHPDIEFEETWEFQSISDLKDELFAACPDLLSELEALREVERAAREHRRWANTSDPAQGGMALDIALDKARKEMEK